MHLDRRGYAYGSFREGGRVCRRYVGRDDEHGTWALLSSCDRERRHIEALERSLERGRLDDLASGADDLKAYCAASNALFRAWMKASGYHQPKRGAWRKARALTVRNPMAKPKTPTELAQSASAPDTEHVTLLKRANGGDKDAAREAVEQVKGKPEEGPMLKLLASFSEVASEALIQGITPNELRRAGFRRQLEVMRDELAGPKPSPLELHLAERAAHCALAVARLERLFEQNASVGVKVWEAVGRQLDGAHRRHLEAVKALATVRKLQLPNVQVNIGEKQVNISNANGAPQSEPSGRTFEATGL